MKGWPLTFTAAAVTATILLVPAVLLFGDDSGRGASAATEPLPGVPLPRAAGKTKLGPERVPLTRGEPLGPAGAPAPGQSRGGVPCGSKEQLRYHVHARLTIYIKGKPRKVPYGIGIGTPRRVNRTDRGPFVAGGRCFSFLHTHAADGIVHIEAPGKVTFKLGQFFDVWGQRLDRRHVGSIRGPVTAYVNGTRYRGDPRGILLLSHAQIQLEIGKPAIPPESITFPAGL